jgi:CheY-like chemotaxis protein
MVTQRRALVAAQPGAWGLLHAMLDGVIELVPAHTRDDAFRVLERDSPFDLILTTIAFDDSQMVEFLRALRADPRWDRTPVLCSRVLPGALSDYLVASMREVCKQCRAVDLVDVARLPRDEAQHVLRAAVARCIEAAGT